MSARLVQACVACVAGGRHATSMRSTRPRRARTLPGHDPGARARARDPRGATTAPQVQSGHEMPAMHPAPTALRPFDGDAVWLNSAPLTGAALHGRVVLVDFWTYSCVNWLRTLPYVRAWAERYADRGLVVIGVHAPEF